MKNNTFVIEDAQSSTKLEISGTEPKDRLEKLKETFEREKGKVELNKKNGFISKEQYKATMERIKKQYSISKDLIKKELKG